MSTPQDPDQLNVIERTGLGFLRRGCRRDRTELRPWTGRDRRRMRALQRNAILLSALAGAASALLIGGLDILLRGRFLGGSEPELARWADELPYWSWFLGLTVAISLAEILAMYWLLLRAVAGISDVAGLSFSRPAFESALMTGLSRAALDIPNPRRPLHGVDPYAGTSRLKLLAYTALYRVKVGATSFVFRILLRRLLARSALRVILPFAAVPVFAAWNGLIAWWVLNEARRRAAGPLAVQALVAGLDPQRLDAADREVLMQTVAEVVVRSSDAHPNYDLLLGRLRDLVGIDPGGLVLDWAGTRRRLAAMDHGAQDTVLDAMLTATVLRGPPRKAQRLLLEDAFRACGRRPRPGLLEDARRRVEHGRPGESGLLRRDPDAGGVQAPSSASQRA